MTSLSSLLIGVVGRRAAARFETATRDPVAAQQRKLGEILARNRDTEYGRAHGFSRISDLRGYRRFVPVATYEDLRGYIERMAEGERNVLTAEAPVMFAMTSGTTGKSKLIPVTPTCRGRDHADQMRVWLHHARLAHPRLFDGKIVSLVSPAVAGRTGAGIPYGSTSGVMYREMNPLVRRSYAIPYLVAEIEDYDAVYYTVMRLALGCDVSMVATANPSSIQKLVETTDACAEELIRDVHDGTLARDLKIDPKIRAYVERRLRRDPARAKALTAARARREGRLLPVDYWPNLRLIACWKGGTVGGAVERFPEWFDPDGRAAVPVRDWGYLSSEARGSIPLSDEGDGGVLTVSTNVFEFVLADELEKYPEDREAWHFLGVDRIEIGKQYYVFITTTGGLYRYDINDVIEVVGSYNRTPVIAFRRKGRGMSNLTGEKLSENQVIEAMNAAAKSLSVNVGAFRAEADPEQMRYVFKVEPESPIPDEKQAALLEQIDETLCEANLEYKSKRASGRLHAPLLQMMKSGWHEAERKQAAADGKPVFQAKEVHLDARQEFEPEPENVESEVALEEPKSPGPDRS
jgi:hypothetical protein